MAHLRIGMVVGEASGDILGAGLMDALRHKFPDATFEGIGGPLMIAKGFNSLHAQERLAVMGFLEPLKRLFELLGIRRQLRQHFSENRPDVFIGIDSPDFNLTLEGQLKEQGIPTAHYVSPSVWAWRQKRIFKIARSVDLMLTLLPFEAAFYEEHQVPVKFVGHPLADDFPIDVDQEAARQALEVPLDTTLIALLPGSRGGEVKLLGDVFIKTAQWCLQKNPKLKFIIPAANAQRREQLEQQLAANPELPIRVLKGQSKLAMQAADAVLMASGTTTLECLLLKKPMVVAYKVAPFSWAIISRLLKTKFVSLPNLLADKELVPEILQEKATPENLGKALMHYLGNTDAATTLKREFVTIHEQLRCNASEQAAQAIAQLVESKKAQEHV
jgi:lipid-A-disaccharide synthase